MLSLLSPFWRGYVKTSVAAGATVGVGVAVWEESFAKKQMHKTAEVYKVAPQSLDQATINYYGFSRAKVGDTVIHDESNKYGSRPLLMVASNYAINAVTFASIGPLMPFWFFPLAIRAGDQAVFTDQHLKFLDHIIATAATTKPQPPLQVQDE